VLISEICRTFAAEKVLNMADFYKNDPKDKIYWIDDPEKIGEHQFTFDKKRIFNLFEDYPHNLTEDQIAIFDKENPYWANFFADRKK